MQFYIVLIADNYTEHEMIEIRGVERKRIHNQEQKHRKQIFGDVSKGEWKNWLDEKEREKAWWVGMKEGEEGKEGYDESCDFKQNGIKLDSITIKIIIGTWHCMRVPAKELTLFINTHFVVFFYNWYLEYHNFPVSVVSI